MDTHELVQHIPGDHLHTFLFTDDVRLTMADIKLNKWGARRAKVEGWQGGLHAEERGDGDATLLLSAPRGSVARRRVCGTPGGGDDRQGGFMG